MRIQPIYMYHTVNFKGYYGDQQPVKKLFWNLGANANTHTNTPLWECNYKKWVNDSPNNVLKRSAAETMSNISALAGGIPSHIPTPNFGDNWGRHANYIEINPRLIAKYDKGTVSDGLLQTTKLLTAIPPSANKNANCIILSQLYPSFHNDGTNRDETLYHTNLHTGISKNLTCRGLDYKMGDDEQVKAFNDIAHLLGFKTGIRMPISAGQLRVKGRDFSWQKDEKAYIDACVWAIELGFDAIFFDSAKHIIDKEGYIGVGEVPHKEQMAYILYKIREQTGRTDLSFIGEKCRPEPIYADMGFSAGTEWGEATDINNIKYESRKQALSYNYAAGPEVSNDNDNGARNFEERLNRLNSCLYGYNRAEDKLPAFMQIADIFPLANYLNTHQVMMNTVQVKGSDAWTECERHWDGVFRNDKQARNYTQEVYKKFSGALYN